MLQRIFVLTVISVLALTGCPPKQHRKETLRTGRTGLSPTGGKNLNGTTQFYNSANPQTVWAQLSSFDQGAVYTFAQPALANAGPDEQLGQIAGIYFWGNVVMNGATIDSSRSRIHLEVFDNKVGTRRADGTQIEQLFIHIGPEQEGFQSVQGNLQTGITFSASYMSITLIGTNTGGTFSGTMYYTNAYSGQQWTPLGQFSVPANGFFVGF